MVNRTVSTAPAFSAPSPILRAILAAFAIAALGPGAGCGRPPPRTPATSHLDLMVRVAGTEASTEALRALDARPAWVLVERYQLTAAFALDVGGPPVALVRTFTTGAVLGLVRCGAACSGVLDRALEDPAERAKLEQTLLRGTEQDRLDGLAVDLTSLTALDVHAVDYVEELAAAAHVAGRKLGVIVRMTCRGLECEGVRGTLARVVAAADVVSLEELDQDVPALEARQKRRVAVLSLELDSAPAPRVFLGVANTSDLATRVVDAGARGLGGVDVGRLGETPTCTFDLLAAWHAKRSPPPCP